MFCVRILSFIMLSVSKLSFSRVIVMLSFGFFCGPYADCTMLCVTPLCCVLMLSFSVLTYYYAKILLWYVP
jgi:hypothetical protein